MPQLIWCNHPTNHSGTVNFLFLDPDGDIGQFTMDVPDGGGPYVLGGPALFDFRGELTEAGRTLLSFLPAGIHVFPQSSAGRIRKAVKEHKAEISDQSSQIHEDEWGLRVYSRDCTTKQSCELLLKKAEPASAIVFVDAEQEGNLLLALELARLYYQLPKDERTRLKLGPDWRHRWET